MQYRVLGPVEVTDEDGNTIDIGGSQPRALLAMLIAANGRVVPADTIIDRLWPDGPPASAASTLQSYVSRLRRVLEPHHSGDVKLLTWEPPGYRLRANDDDVDARRFERAADAGRELITSGSLDAAQALLAAALAEWRGAALLDFADQPWARGVASRLDERRLAAIEDHIQAELACGRHAAAVGDLQALVEANPLRESLWEHLAVALYRSGRQVEALRTIDELRRQLLEGSGIDPSPRIRELERQILDHAPALSAPTAPAQPPDAAGAESTQVPGWSLAGLTRGSKHYPGYVSSAVVGRVAEQRALTTALAGVQDGRTHWVLFEGEPGIGKTRLLEQLADEATAQGFDVFWGRSHETGAGPAFWPWLPPLRRLAEASYPLPPQTQELLDRLLWPTSENPGTAPTDVARFPLFEGIAFLLECAARDRPLMIALDDLQWADTASLELVEFLTGYVVGTRLLIAATVRDLDLGRNDGVVHALAQISRRPNTLRLHLGGLTRADADQLVRQAIGTDPPAELVAAIHARADGNPFFITELARLLAAEAGLSEAELVRRVGVPAGVRDVLHRRLVRLPAPTVELLQFAATLGRSCHVGLLAAAASVPIDRCLDDLEPALVNRLIVEVQDSPGLVQFSHALVREVVLDDMSVLRRSRLHLRAADALESFGGRPDDHAEIVADHLWHAASLGIEERAATALERAADVALRRMAFETADNLLDRALRLRSALSDGRGDPDAELDVLNRLISLRRARFGFEKARLMTPLERGKDVARSSGRRRMHAELLWADWAAAATACDLPRAHKIVLDMLDLAAAADDQHLRSLATSSWGIQCWHEGRIAEAVESLDAAMSDLSDMPEPGSRGVALPEHRVLARGFHVLVHEQAGAPFPGGSPLPDLARSLGDPYSQLMAWSFEITRSVVGNDLAAGEAAAAAALAIELSDEFQFFRANTTCQYGTVQVMAGRAEIGLEAIRAGLAAFEGVGVLTGVPFYMAAASDALLVLDDVRTADTMIQRAFETGRRSGEMWEMPFVVASAAAVDQALGKPTDAVVDRLRIAHAMATSQGAFGTAQRVLERAASLGVAAVAFVG